MFNDQNPKAYFFTALIGILILLLVWQFRFKEALSDSGSIAFLGVGIILVWAISVLVARKMKK